MTDAPSHSIILGPAMTNPSAQTMLADAVLRHQRIFVSTGYKQGYFRCDYCFEHGTGDDHAVTHKPECPVMVATEVKSRAASAPAAVRDREAIARIIYPGAWDIKDRGFTLAGKNEVESSLAKADAILALATPEEASTAAGEAATLKTVIDALFDADKEWGPNHAAYSYIEHLATAVVARLAAPPAAQTDAPSGARPFYGAECPSYPNCQGGCGLGCTKKIETAAAQTDGVREARPLPKNFNEQFVIFRLQTALAPLMKIQRTYGEGDGTQATSSLFLAEDGRKVTVTVRIDSAAASPSPQVNPEARS